jgi:hypothetical protein
MEHWQKEWIVNLLKSYNDNRLLTAKRMSEMLNEQINECWQLLDQVRPMTQEEREKYRSLGIQ